MIQVNRNFELNVVLLMIEKFELQDGSLHSSALRQDVVSLGKVVRERLLLEVSFILDLPRLGLSLDFI